MHSGGGPSRTDTRRRVRAATDRYAYFWRIDLSSRLPTLRQRAHHRPAPKPLPEVAVSPKKVAPLASAQKRGIQRQSAGRTPLARDNRTLEPASSDPSDPAGVIDWLLKESARGR